MNFLKKLLWKWTYEGREITDSSSNVIIRNNKLSVADEPDVSGDPILNFKVFNAVGGKIVEFRYYDRIKDRTSSQTYIITNDQDFGERIAKIATIESLKQ